MQLIRRSVDRLQGYLPGDLNVDVMICDGNVFAHVGMEGHVEGTFPPVACEQDDLSEWSSYVDGMLGN